MAPELIIAAVERHMGQRLAWGESDCCVSARNVFRDLHGIDLMPSSIDYDSATGAMRVIAKHGGFTKMASALANEAGLREGLGVPGEIGISHHGATDGVEGRALLICIEPGAWAGKTEYGYAILPSAERSWRV